MRLVGSAGIGRFCVETGGSNVRRCPFKQSMIHTKWVDFFFPSASLIPSVSFCLYYLTGFKVGHWAKRWGGRETERERERPPGTHTCMQAAAANNEWRVTQIQEMPMIFMGRTHTAQLVLWIGDVSSFQASLRLWLLLMTFSSPFLLRRRAHKMRFEAFLPPSCRIPTYERYRWFC